MEPKIYDRNRALPSEQMDDISVLGDQPVYLLPSGHTYREHRINVSVFSTA